MTSRARRWLPPTLAIMAFLGACGPEPQPYKGVDISRMAGGGDFTLTAHTGRPLQLTDLRGKVVLIFFGYSHCPDICSPALLRLANVIRDLGPQAEQVQVLFITVDPERDTPQRLAEFVPRFHPSFIGLTGSPEEIKRVAGLYRVAYERNTENPGLFVHSGNVFALDRRGRTRLMFRDGTAPADMAADVRRLLREGS